MVDHVVAIKALIEPLDIFVCGTDVPASAPDKRVVVTAPNLATTQAAMAGDRDIRDYVQVKYCGANEDQARSVGERVAALLDRSHPVVEGWSTDLRRTATSPFFADRNLMGITTDSHVVAATDTYRYTAWRN